MKTRPVVMLAASLMLPFGAVDAQEHDRPTLLVPPWGGPRNMAAEVGARVLGGLDSLGSFARLDWDDLLDSSPVTRDLSESRRAQLGCTQARQMAVLEDIEYVLCGRLLPTPDGILMEVELWDTEASSRTELASLVATDQETLADHAIGQVQRWSP
jgi:hypothetical protein